ncbi:MAG: hypothetical protein OXR73_18520 [Myxococcales bacterium]|nr:hypothetical protein [Myxococcales bacterium]
MTPSGADTRRELVWGGGATAVSLLVPLLVRAWMGARVFPRPWSDEVHFLLPSAPFQSGRLFNAEGMLNPQGIYWIPSGFTVFHASWSTLLGETTLAGARFASALLIAIAAGALFRFGRLAAPSQHPWQAAILAVSWATTVQCTIAANVARPEALVLPLVIGSGIYAMRRDRIATVSLAVIAALVHPLLAFPALLYGYLTLWTTGRRSAWPARAALLACALALAALELTLLLTHWETYIGDWVYQLQRKKGRPLGPLTFLSMGAVGAVVVLAPIALRIGRAWPDTWRITVLAAGVGGFLFVQGYGQEMWYTPFTVTAGLMLLLSGAAGADLLGRGQSGFGRVVGRIAAYAAGPTMLAASMAIWLFAFARGHIQGLPIELQQLREMASDLDEVAAMVAEATERDPGRLLVSDVLTGDAISDLQRGRLFTTNARSVAPLEARFVRALSFKQGSDLSEALAGHRCIAQREMTTTFGHFAITDMTLRPSEQRAGRGFEPCVPLKATQSMEGRR